MIALIPETPIQAGSRRERRKEETRRRLLTAAERLFHAKGFEATTVEEIAAAADIAKGTFFNYFESKQTLLVTLTFARVQSLLAEPPAPGQPATERITCTLRAMGDELFPYRDVAQQIFMHAQVYPLPTGPTPAQVLAAMVREGQRQGEFNPDVDANIAGELLAAYFIRLFVVYTCLLPAAPSPHSWYARLDAGLQIIFHGLLAPEAPRP